MNYEEYSSEHFTKMSEEQDTFLERYDINSYESWFYDQESELLRLYNKGENEIFFNYIPVGSYSLKSNTWMWSWHNEGSIEKRKLSTLIVKNEGIKLGYKFLTEGLFECNQDECWYFVAISKTLIDGIGVYCTQSEDFFKYIIIEKQFANSDSQEVRKLKQKTVDCGIHGFRRPAFVCQHLNLEQPKGFEESFETNKGMFLDDEEDLSAWCKECENHRIKHDGWNAESEKFAAIKLVCEECYFELKEYNKK